MKNILIVDDSSTLRKMVIFSLRDIKGVVFHEAGNGLEAIEKLALVRVDLMILDLNMPDMPGIEVIKFTRSHNAFINIPIIVLTTKGDDASRKEALAAGATLYLTKPFRTHFLAEQAKNILLKKDIPSGRRSGMYVEETEDTGQVEVKKDKNAENGGTGQNNG